MMRYGFMQRIMWIMFSSSFKEAIKTVLDETDEDGIMKRAKKKYREIYGGGRRNDQPIHRHLLYLRHLHANESAGAF